VVEVAKVIAIDTNLLVYAHRSATPEHRVAQTAIETACSSRSGCGIAASSIAEFYSIVTHPAARGRPSTAREAAAFLRALQEDGGLEVWGPGPQFATRLLQTAGDLNVRGARVFDLQIAICALDGGATELWTHDSAFVKVPGLRFHDPLSSSA
jgi:toxin-antitoxin system PIN domain toxin